MYEALGRDDDAGSDDGGDLDETGAGPPRPPVRPFGRARLLIAASAVAGLVAAAWLTGSSGDLSGENPRTATRSAGPPRPLVEAPTFGPGKPADNLGIGQVCEPELVTGDTRSQDRLTVSFALINGRDLPLELTSVTPQLSRPGLLKPYQVRAGGRCSDVGGEDVARRLASGTGVLLTLRFRLLDHCPNAVAVRVVVRATFVDGSPAAQHPIPQTVHLTARLPVLDSLPAELFPGC